MTKLVHTTEKQVIMIEPFGRCSSSHMTPQCPSQKPEMKMAVSVNLARVKYLWSGLWYFSLFINW
jgi:hypothetical protein